jgi:hypothetical protein
MVIFAFFQMKAYGWKVSSSSYLNNATIYAPDNLFDKSLHTAWAEGAKNEGVGEWALIKFDYDKKIDDIGIFNGYQKNTNLFEDNNRVKELEISISDGTKKIVTLEDAKDVQWIPLNKQTQWIKFRILSVYKGKKYNDTCLTEIIFSHKEIFSEIDKVCRRYFAKGGNIADIYNTYGKDDVQGWVFFEYLSLGDSEGSVQLIFDLRKYNEKIYKEKKSQNSFVAESCSEAMQEKILNYPATLLPYINQQYPEELKLIVYAYEGLKNNYMGDVKGMTLVKEHFKKLYSSANPEIKKILKNVISAE